MKSITNLEQAFNQLAYRLENGRYEPNKRDLDAFKVLATWTTEQKKQSLKNDILFAKLFCRVFAQEVHFYKGNFKFAQKAIHEYLKHPLEHYYDRFLAEINQNAMNLYASQIGLDMDSQNLITEEEKEILKESEMIKYINGYFEQEKVYKSLNNNITEFINLYKNAE